MRAFSAWTSAADASTWNPWSLSLIHIFQSDRILDNFRILQKQAGRTPLLPLLEANAYGFGDAETARLLAGEGVGALAVSRLEEGIRVAEAVRGVDILLMTPYAGEEDCLTILKYGLIAAVGSNDSAVLLSSLGLSLIHIYQ